MVRVVRTVQPIFYFDNKMIEEEEMEKQIDDGTFDECAYVKDDDDLCA